MHNTTNLELAIENPVKWMQRRIADITSGECEVRPVKHEGGKYQSDVTWISISDHEELPFGHLWIDNGGVVRMSFGKEEVGYEAVRVRQAAGEAFLFALKALNVKNLHISCDELRYDHDKKMIFQGVKLAMLRADEFARKRKKLPDLVTFYDPGETITQRVIDHANALNIMRWLMALPSNILTVESFSQLIDTVLREHPEAYSCPEPTATNYASMGLLQAVSHGNGGHGRVLSVAINARNAESRLKHVAFVGKGIVFDVGGSTQKSDGGRHMKGDMGGAAALFAAAWYFLRHREELREKRVRFVFAISENVDGPSAYRPDDVLSAYDGTTVEVHNTDAEGRLVMADAAAWVCDVWPELDCAVTVATLTGAAMSALGTQTALMMRGSESGRNSRIARRIEDLGRELGEPTNILHGLAEAREKLNSSIADIANSSSDHLMGAQQGAAFCQHFIPDNMIAVSLDIAGSAGEFDKSPGLQDGTGWPAGFSLIHAMLTMDCF